LLAIGFFARDESVETEKWHADSVDDGCVRAGESFSVGHFLRVSAVRARGCGEAPLKEEERNDGKAKWSNRKGSGDAKLPMMNLFPIVTRELRCLNWQRGFYRERFGVGAAAGAGLGALILADHFGGNIKMVPTAMAVLLASVGPFMVFILGLHGAGSLLAAERREGTLPLLLMTRLSGWDIIFGKLLQSVLKQGMVFLAAIPGLVLPLLAIGFGYTELSFLVLAYGNVLFFSLALGLLGSVFADQRSAASWCLFFFLPIFVYSSPFAAFLTGGRWMEWLALLQWLNPCAAVARAQGAAAGWRSELFWGCLVTTHALGWLLAALAGLLLPGAVRRQAAEEKKKGWTWFKEPLNGSFQTRKRLLDRNPFLWLNSRERWTSATIWLWLVVPALAWGWLIALIWVWRTLNVAVVFVIGIGATWALSLLFIIPAQATRQVLADRLSGGFELVLCTPATPQLIAQGIWLALRRYYLAPTFAVLVSSAALMASGYVTSGFGGMLDADDRPLWLWAWMTAIGFLPVALWTLCWVSLRRTLFASNVGEASAISFMQVFGTVGLVLWSVSMVTGVSYSRSWVLSAIMAVVSACILGGFAVRARGVFLKGVRSEV
jgi:hypothetical protein